MKTPLLSLILAVTVIQFTLAESFPGYRHPALVTDPEVVSDNGAFALIFVRLADDTLAVRDVVIRYDVKTRRIASACWVTKANGNFEFQLPTMGLYVPQKPIEEKKMMLMMSVEKITDVSKQKMAFVGIFWGNGPK